MKVVIAPEAEAQILIRKQWWRSHRSKAPERFDEELAAALVAIADRAESFPIYSARAGRTVRLCLLAKTRCHLYFEILGDRAEVWVLAARGAAQRRGPKLASR